MHTGKRVRLRYRDMIWAFHSESQDILLNASITACNGKMCWSDARALGISIWIGSVETLVRCYFLIHQSLDNGDSEIAHGRYRSE
jgi:RAVE protein 1 C terminal